MTDFHLDDFLPYLLNNASEVTGRAFSTHYRAPYGMSRAQWRIMAHLGRGQPMTATDIGARAHLEKSKVSRAVAALEQSGYLTRRPSATDRRAELLELTEAGRRVHSDLAARALQFQDELAMRLGTQQFQALTDLLRDLAKP
ncbi:MAG: MarR family transcriptional regulator [Paracoccus denitrificans]|uniref:MarR family transcriptional regulator n=1 Tax=Paracoccus denitrificans TaxID=266 RepID=A0A533I8G8_PARDE|nr:MAG: MarR family transcriptional regulator [Paracoccus denitrificans]